MMSDMSGNMSFRLIFGCITLMLPVSLIAQLVGNIRGVVTDVASGRPLPRVSVVVLHSNPSAGTVTDSAGYFRLSGLPVGRYDIQTNLVGYEPVVYREILVSSVKEAFMEIAMQESIRASKEVMVRPKTNREAPLNRMAVPGARTFSVEECRRIR